jgi:hypothetical protein
MGPAIGRWLQDFLKRSKAKQKVLAMARGTQQSGDFKEIVSSAHVCILPE